MPINAAGDFEAIKFEVDVGDLNRLSQVSGEMADVVRKKFKEGMDEAGMLLTGLAAVRTPVNTGNLKGGIQYPQGYKLEEKAGSLDDFRGIIGAGDYSELAGVAASTYVIFVEEDTKPHWAPIAPLKLYAIRKFNDERVAYAIQRKIAKFGTTGQKMFERAWNEQGKTKTDAIMKQIPKDVIAEFRSKLR